MFIVRVIPIARGVFKDHLTFFSREPIEPGMAVTVSVRNRSIPALVIESKDAREEKSELRSAGFALKKISPKAKPKRILTSAFVAAAKDAALWHGVHEGALLSALTSSLLLNAPSKLESAMDIPLKGSAEEPGIRADLLVLQAEKEERVRTYRNIARESFARGESVLVIAPTVIEAEELYERLKRGIEEHVLLFTSDLTNKKLIETWNRSVTDVKPALIIGTALALSLPRAHVGTIIVERESARGYRGFSRPHVDVRRSAESLARRLGARFILADFPLRIETRYRVDAHEMDELARSQARPASGALLSIMDVRKKVDGVVEGAKVPSKRGFTALTEETKEKMRHELARGGRAVVFAARRGIAPLTVCSDCGTPVTDPDTGVPMVLHKTVEGNVFMSHRSGATLPSETPCKTCGGWNLVTLGIGVERVADELAKAFPDTPLITFTKDSAPTHRAAKKLAEEFFETPGAILVGTERMLPYLKEPVEIVVVATVDSMLSIPAWRAHEHALSILFYLEERAELSFIVETRKSESEVMQALLGQNPADFYRADIAERERYGYPPFTTFLGLVWSGTRAHVEKKSLEMQELFSDSDLVGPLPPVATGKNEWSARAVIRVPRKSWPDARLSERLRALPPDIEVTVDPDEIV